VGKQNDEFNKSKKIHSQYFSPSWEKTENFPRGTGIEYLGAGNILETPYA